jgi:hypothetical protein
VNLISSGLNRSVREREKHTLDFNKMKLKLDTYDLHFEELSDKQRMELIKELIFTAADVQEFQQKAVKIITHLEID